MLAKLLPLLPPHRHYVEPFGGGASLLLAKPPCGGVETYNDLDEGLYEFFTVLADPELFPRFKRRVEALPYSRQLYRECRDTWRDAETRLERTARWFVVARQSFSGDFGASWSFAVTKTSKQQAVTCSTWQSALERLPEIHARLQGVQIENTDWSICLERYSGPGYLAYCDPPYHHDTRSYTGYYEDDVSHEDLVDCLLAYEGAVVLSGYRHPVYEPLENAGWTRKDFKTACHAAGRTRGSNLRGEGALLEHQARIESVWRNPEAKRRLDKVNMPLFAGEANE